MHIKVSQIGRFPLFLSLPTNLWSTHFLFHYVVNFYSSKLFSISPDKKYWTIINPNIFFLEISWAAFCETLIIHSSIPWIFNCSKLPGTLGLRWHHIEAHVSRTTAKVKQRRDWLITRCERDITDNGSELEIESQFQSGSLRSIKRKYHWGKAYIYLFSASYGLIHKT